MATRQYDRITQAELDKISAHFRRVLEFTKHGLKEQDLTAEMGGADGAKTSITISGNAADKLGLDVLFSVVPRVIASISEIDYVGQPKRDGMSDEVSYVIECSPEFLAQQTAKISR